MKIVVLHPKEQELIVQAKANNRLAQQAIYNKYAPKMLAICRRYFKDVFLAEDVLLQAFLKVFVNITQYNDQGSFEGWIRRIVVHECIDAHRKQIKQLEFVTIAEHDFITEETELTHDAEQILLLVNDLPEGCKMIFNLFVIEGYKHHEIATRLQISEGTSKSQLAYAKTYIQKALQQLKTNEHGTAR
ncbi:RNA polymerase sigma factor [Flavobacterium agricola]|uniref:RNA polymerase sigma factor n=1 Tax=Flavobacterium agricola TaxID=2870839 RepID=A0ABY6LZ34_9FLAO|nr:RNA polymerase sigma factor [Flavobacterium agricola]UYW00669.1 RNA polymerase sigma factor [Flavobacterium agricola]